MKIKGQKSPIINNYFSKDGANRTKIIVIVLLVLLKLYIGIGEDPLYALFTSIEGGFQLFETKRKVSYFPIQN
jgi:hypothetical protein